jgi:hypothetical protein
MVQVVRNLEVMPDRSFALRMHPESWVDTVVLGAAGTAEAYVPPAGATYLLFNSTADFWARPNAALAGTAAAVPSTEIANGTSSILNPTQRFISLSQVAEVSLVSETAGCRVVIEVFRS